MLKYIISDGRVKPDDPRSKTCALCVEPGASKRKCCNALYCDHCYTKNQKCPNCGAGTRQEKLTGATYQLQVFSEHEECRICLEPGLPRRCCNNYYCDNCYYSVNQCRSCGNQVGHVGKESKLLAFLDRAALSTNLIGWAITIFIALSMVAFFVVVLNAELETPVTLSEFKCYGFFRECGVSVCIDMDESVANGSNALPSLSSWRDCTLNSTVKLQSKACIYDQLLYYQSDRLLGYDVCEDNFNKGVYVFEDTFENWVVVDNANTTTMKSARWKTVHNAYTSSVCGVGQNFGGASSLTFRGEQQRYATTEDVDLSSGGRLEFEMMMPPIGFDVSNELCRTGFQGKVFVDYSTNQGVKWTEMAVYDPRFYRQTAFFPGSLEVPAGGISNSTRFRFEQRNFESARDNWALDNVRVLRYLPTDWSNSAKFTSNVAKAQATVQKAQCCLDTDWCEQRFSLEETKQCGEDFSWYGGENYLIRLSEIFLLFTCLINVLKFIYLSIQDWYMKGRIPFNDEIVEFLSLDRIDKLVKKYVPLRYRPRKIVPDEFTNNIHASARMEEALRAQFADEEGTGEMMHKKEVLEKERKEAARKVKKAKRRLQERQKQKNFKQSTVVEVIEDEQKIDTKLGTLKELEQISEGGFNFDQEADDDDSLAFAVNTELTTEKEKEKRQNHAMLRVPFEVEENKQWRQSFAIVSLSVFTILFLVQLSITKYYSIHEPVRPYGAVEGEIRLDSVALIFAAAWCDLKEIFHTVKYIIPARDRWMPLVTLDLSDEGRALVVANFVVPIQAISEYGAFSENYIIAMVGAHALGVFPWCLFALLLREAVLEYASMRIVTPFLGSVMVARAMLGPSFVVKMVMAVHFMFACNWKNREKVGVAFQTENTKNIAYTTSFGLAILTLLICSAVAFDWLGIMFAVAVFAGAVYGAFTGCIHNLPIRPWMYITTLRGGVWMRLRKRQRCPCLYWGKYCTEMHNYEEVFVLFVSDEVKFMSMINGGMAGHF